MYRTHGLWSVSFPATGSWSLWCASIVQSAHLLCVRLASFSVFQGLHNFSTRKCCTPPILSLRDESQTETEVDHWPDPGSVGTLRSGMFWNLKGTPLKRSRHEDLRFFCQAASELQTLSACRVCPIWQRVVARFRMFEKLQTPRDQICSIAKQAHAKMRGSFYRCVHGSISAWCSYSHDSTHVPFHSFHQCFCS